jgi:hypothetical protein
MKIFVDVAMKILIGMKMSEWMLVMIMKRSA